MGKNAIIDTRFEDVFEERLAGKNTIIITHFEDGFEELLAGKNTIIINTRFKEEIEERLAEQMQ